jgi:hypothetical protein
MSWKKVSTRTDQMTKGYDKFKKRKKTKNGSLSITLDKQTNKITQQQQREVST